MEENEDIVVEWCEIIRTVFSAETAISYKWDAKLRMAEKLQPLEKMKLADEYVHAVANEILRQDMGLPS